MFQKLVAGGGGQGGLDVTKITVGYDLLSGTTAYQRNFDLDKGAPKYIVAASVNELDVYDCKNDEFISASEFAEKFSSFFYSGNSATQGNYYSQRTSTHFISAVTASGYKLQGYKSSNNVFTTVIYE